MASPLRMVRRLYQSARGRSLTGLVLILLSLISVNVLAGRFLQHRLDLTEERMYTLSRATRQTLARIDEAITLRFYASLRLGQEAPTLAGYAARVEALLQQYVRAANGKLRLEVYHPGAFSGAEDDAIAAGLHAAPLDPGDEAVYFGLTGNNSTDDEQTIAFFTREREPLLEYDLTRLVQALALPKRTVVGLIGTPSLDVDSVSAPRSTPARPQAMLQQLRQLYRVESLPMTLDSVPADIDVLMLIDPQNLPGQTLFAIDQFVLRGGGALVFVNPDAEAESRGPTPRTRGLPDLFRAWGFRLSPDAVPANAGRVGIASAAGAAPPAAPVARLGLSGDALNRSDPITAGLHRVVVGSGGLFEPIPGATTTLEPLLRASADTMKLPAKDAPGLPDRPGPPPDFKFDRMRDALALRVTGPAASAFPNGPPKAAVYPSEPGRQFAGPTAGVSLETLRPIDVVVVADPDFLDSRFWSPATNNGDFVANAIDVLARREDLVGLRSRSTATRRFEVIDAMQQEVNAGYVTEQQALEHKIENTQAELREVTVSDGAEGEQSSTPEEVRAVELRGQLVAARRQLRGLRAGLQQKADSLEVIIEFIDIALVPMLVAVMAAIVGARRRRHSEAAMAAARS